MDFVLIHSVVSWLLLVQSAAHPVQSNITSELKSLFRGHPFPRSADLARPGELQVWVPTKTPALPRCSDSEQFLCPDYRCVSEYWMCDVADVSESPSGEDDVALWKKRRSVFHAIVVFAGVVLVFVLLFVCLCSVDDENIYRLNQRNFLSNKRKTVVHRKSQRSEDSSPLLSPAKDVKMQQSV